jgi:hypothetical protein
MQVRLLVGDNIANAPQLQDEEITFFLTQRASIYGGAAECCRFLASQMSRQADTVQGDMRTMYSARAKSYAMRAADFENKAKIYGSSTPYAGGISISDKLQQVQDTDRVAPQFNIGMDDNYLPLSPAGNETDTDGIASGTS